jgi:hypothetical protein
MKTQNLLALAATLALFGGAGYATAQTAGTTSTRSSTTATPTPATSSTVSKKLTDSFSSFAGSQENSASLVNGLRTGNSVTLTGTNTDTTSFTPPTKPMGYGNIRIALSLARTQLASRGITNPTPQELQGALLGSTTMANGTTTQTQGILQMCADGMGWGKIASTMGFKLGTVMSGKTPANVQTTQTTAAGGATTTTAGRSTRIVTGASGASAGSHGSKGIVTASGASAGGNSGAMNGGMAHNAAGHGGVVTGAGVAGHGNSAGGLGKH